MVSGAFSHLYDKYWVYVSLKMLWAWMIVVWAYICCTVAIGQHLLVLLFFFFASRKSASLLSAVWFQWMKGCFIYLFSLPCNGERCFGSPRLSKRDMFMFWPPASWSKSVSVWFWLESVPGISVLKSCGLLCFYVHCVLHQRKLSWSLFVDLSSHYHKAPAV